MNHWLVEELDDYFLSYLADWISTSLTATESLNAVSCVLSSFTSSKLIQRLTTFLISSSLIWWLVEPCRYVSSLKARTVSVCRITLDTRFLNPLENLSLDCGSSVTLAYWSCLVTFLTLLNRNLDYSSSACRKLMTSEIPTRCGSHSGSNSSATCFASSSGETLSGFINSYLYFWISWVTEVVSALVRFCLSLRISLSMLNCRIVFLTSRKLLK